MIVSIPFIFSVCLDLQNFVTENFSNFIEVDNKFDKCVDISEKSTLVLNANRVFGIFFPQLLVLFLSCPLVFISLIIVL